MKHLSLLAAALLAACASPSGPPPSGPAPSVETAPAGRALTAEFGAALNAYRQSEGLPPLAPAAGLERAASAHARDMAQKGYFSHDSRDGRSAFDRMGAEGCAGWMAENISGGRSSVAAVIAGWKASPGHDKNMLRRDVRLFGIGRAGDIWVLNLAGRCGG